MEKNNFQLVAGFTLVEIMIAMLIAVIILGGVYQTLVTESVEREDQELILDMQNNARAALEKVVRDIRRTGFLGCGGKLEANTISNAGTDLTLLADKTSALTSTQPCDVCLGNDTCWDCRQSLLNELKLETNVHYLGTSIGFYGNAIPAHPIYDQGTDAISLTFLGQEVTIAGGMASSTSPISLTKPAFAVGDLLVASDCSQFSFFQKTADTDGNLAPQQNLWVPSGHNELGQIRSIP